MSIGSYPAGCGMIRQSTEAILFGWAAPYILLLAEFKCWSIVLYPLTSGDYAMFLFLSCPFCGKLVKKCA